jgi:hypothetical protein
MILQGLLKFTKENLHNCSILESFTHWRELGNAVHLQLQRKDLHTAMSKADIIDMLASMKKPSCDWNILVKTLRDLGYHTYATKLWNVYIKNPSLTGT